MDMMDSVFDFTIIWSLFGSLISIALFGVSLYLVIKKAAIESIFLVIGTFIQMLTTLFYSVGLRIFASIGADVYSNSFLFSVIGGIGFLGSACFAAGFIILVIKYIQKSKNNPVNY